MQLIKNMKNKLCYSFGVIILVCGLISCEKLDQSIKDTLNQPNQEVNSTQNQDLDLPVSENFVEPEKIFVDDTIALKEVEQKLRNRPELKGKPIKVYQSIHFYENYRVLMKIQNPDNPTYVDEYYYSNGNWETKPVVTSKHDNIEKDLVDLDRLNFINANHVYKVLREKLDEIKSSSQDFTVYVVTYNNKIRWYPRTIGNQRSEYSIEYDEQGFLKSFEQN